MSAAPQICIDDDFCHVRFIHLNRVRAARLAKLSDKETAKMAAIFKVLGDPTRLSIVSALRDGEMCVCDLAAFLKMTESAVSHHLRRLRDLSLVKNRRDGQVLYYSLDDDHVQALVTMALDHVRE
ncbi:MAG: transcriptional regulator [Deltaproteobacteria bacterium]|nr:MAG: transcriptional regulator [Deltaproteobacteria bacterium]RUA00542.1 MAG: transcriptional regulator [Deltaproteobacteria bacterium]